MKWKNFNKSQLIFSYQDLKLQYENFDRRRLYERQKKWHIIKIKKWYYILNTKKIWNNELYMISNKIYEPSYISLETALSYYNLIPEWVFTTTAISSKKTNQFNSPIWLFTYKNVKKELFGWYTTINIKDIKFNIATIEKSIFDMIYLNNNFKNKNDFDGRRLDCLEITNKRNSNKLKYFAKISKNKKIQNIVSLFINYVKENA